MKASDKAKELLWKYLPIIDGWTSKEKTDLAKQCALICVDEIILEILSLTMESSLDNYWQEVKKEIEKL